MAGKRFTAEQIIIKLREAEVGLAQGRRVGQVSKQIGVSEQTYYRWRKEYGGLRLDQAKRLKVLEKANTRLKKLVADLSLDGIVTLIVLAQDAFDHGRNIGPLRGISVHGRADSSPEMDPATRGPRAGGPT